MAVSILAPLIQTWLIFSALGSLLHLSPPSSSGRRNLYADLVKEQLRALGFIFWGFLLFIVPGFIRFFRYLFVPLVVSFDERYVRGQRDALRASAAVWRENRLKVLVYVFLIFGMIPLVLTLGDEWNKPFRLPLVSLPFQMMEALVVIWAHLLLFKMWRKTHDETLLSVE